MPPKTVPCAVCGQVSKYRCSACPVRYCSVACYKAHKETCEGSAAAAAAAPAPSLEPEAGVKEETDEEAQPPPAHDPDAGDALSAKAQAKPLRPLTSLKWPPEPDPMVFSDPLRRDDPKPLRHSELERIATSDDLRDVLESPVLVKVLEAVDSLPTAPARHGALARLLGVDTESLARPAAAATLDRGSPPPLGDLLAAAAAASRPEPRDDWGAGTDGWWLGRGDGRVWVGEEERRLVRLWAGVVVRAIDADGTGDWGEGALAWEVA